MCNAMKIEIPVAGDVNTSMRVQTDLKENGGKDDAALGHRPSQPLKGRDFFVPVSQREKPPRKLVEEVAKPNAAPPAAVEDAAKKKRGRPRKNSLEDDNREFVIPLPIKDSPKKLSLIEAIGPLNSETILVAEDGAGKGERLIKERPQKTSSINALLAPSSAASTVAEEGAERGEKPRSLLTEDYGSEFFVPFSKRERLNKELFGDEAVTLVKAISTRVEDGAKKRGRPRKSSLEDEGNTSKGSPLGEADDTSKPKRGRPRKILLDDLHSRAFLGNFQDNGKQKQGKPRKDSSGEEGNLEEIAKPSGFSEDAIIFPGQLPLEGKVSAVVVVSQNVTDPKIVSDMELARVPLMQSDTENQGKEIQDKEGKQVARGPDLRDPQLSQGASCDDFFIPVSKRRKRKEELLDKKPNNKRNAPSKTKVQKDGHAEKLLIEGVPAGSRLHPLLAKDKKSLIKGLPQNENTSAHSDSAVLHSEHDLRLEAVLAAQENVRLNAGKTTHPFFARKKVSSLKTSVVWEEASAFQVEDLQPGPPMHVTQLSEGERTEVVWSDWKLRSPSVKENIKVEFCKPERKRCRLMQHPLPVWAEPDQRPDGQVIPTNGSELATSRTLNVEEAHSDGNESTYFLKDLQDIMQHIKTLKSTVKAIGEQAQPPEVGRSIEADFSLENLKDKLSLYSARHNLLKSAENVPMSQISKESDGEVMPSTRNLLWTDLYQPRSSKEVCGNIAAVEGLSTWLYNWQLKITGQPIKGEDANKDVKADRAADYDSDKGWFDSDSDIDSDVGDFDDDTGLQNTLLVTGPEGCGKSAAVYACAGEQGFTVIEVNASDCRNGALIKQKFGEALESHGLGKGSQPGVESPQAASIRALNIMQESSPGKSKHNGNKQKKIFPEKRLVDRSPIKSQQEKPVASQDENQMDTQSKRKTLILFEDVDKHFDEDKGFLTALMQLSKTTKRPIILTSNRYEPGLPPALEKCRVDLGYPTSEELVLHACLVSIAEGVPCSPWLLERFVDSCHYDLRKVMMALQFWGQGNAPSQQLSVLSRPGGRGRLPHDLENHQLAIHGTTNNLDRSSKVSLSREPSKGSFQQWASDARWLFELDVHHFILPKIIGGNFVCPLTLLVGEKISTAAKELEEHMEQVAARESEERGRAKQAEYESLELTRKALKKEKDARRKASQFYPKVLADGVINLTPDEDVELESRCGESWACSPAKSLREAKILARSPMKPKVSKSRRALLLCDSDDEEQKLHTRGSIKTSNQGISRVETHLPGVPIIIANSQDPGADVVSENLEDIDVIPSSISEVMTKSVRRKRLSKKDSTLETDLPKVESSPVSRMVEIIGKVPHLKVQPLEIDIEEFKVKRSLVGPEVTSKILAEESELQFLALDESDRLNTELNSSMSGLCKGSANLEIRRQQSAKYFGSSGENQIETIILSGGERLVENTSIDTIAPQQPDLIEESNHIDDSVLKDAHLVSEVTGQAGDMSRGVVLPPAKVYESAERTVTDVSLNNGLDAQKGAKDSTSSSFEPVHDAWTRLRESQQTSKSLLDHADKIADVTSCLSELLDIISASDVISCVEPEEFKDAWRDFDGTFSEAFEGNIGHSSDWDGCQEIASQLVYAGLQHSLPFLPAANHPDYRLPVLSSILECGKDPPAVGKCMLAHIALTRGSQQSSKLYGMVDNVSAKMSPIRQADRQARLEEVVQAAVFPRGRVSRSGFVEYSAYLSRMSQLEETRRTNGLIQGRRPRRFEHHLTSKLKSLSSSDIADLLKYSNFQSS